MKKIFIPILTIFALCFIIYFLTFYEKSTIIVEYVENVGGTEITQREQLRSSIEPDKDNTTYHIDYHNGEKTIIIDTQYHNFIHPCSWIYIHTDPNFVRIDKIYIEYNDSIYKLNDFK